MVNFWETLAEEISGNQQLYTARKGAETWGGSLACDDSRASTHKHVEEMDYIT
jgi:hypothetical protein